MRTIILLSICTLIGAGCTFQNKTSNYNTDIPFPITNAEEDDDYSLYINSVKGHDERESIYGNFTGYSNDSLYVKALDEENSFKVVSNNPRVPILT